MATSSLERLLGLLAIHSNRLVLRQTSPVFTVCGGTYFPEDGGAVWPWNRDLMIWLMGRAVLG